VADKLRYFYNSTRQALLSEMAPVADNFLARLRGLLMSPPLKQGEGLYISPCKSIHMFCMTYAIDVVFFDKEGSVVGLVEEIKPNCVSSYFVKATSCLELPAGTIAQTKTSLDDKVYSGSCPFEFEDVLAGTSLPF